MYLRLLDTNPELASMLVAQQALRISNDLYSSHVLSVYEPAKGFCTPLISSPTALPIDLVKAQETPSVIFKYQNDQIGLEKLNNRPQIFFGTLNFFEFRIQKPRIYMTEASLILAKQVQNCKTLSGTVLKLF